MLSCNQCGYEWKPRAASAGNPSCCPKCKRYDWDEPSKKLSRGGERANTAPARKRSEVAPRVTPPSDAMLLVQVQPPATNVPVYEDDDEVQMCPYKEYDPESGETYRCGLVVHSPKVKHTRGERV